MTTNRELSIEAACLQGLNALSIIGAVALLCLELGTAHGATELLSGSLSLDGTRQIATTPERVANSSASAVDFRYSPPEWQTAICLPDDPQKSLVDRTGELLYHYNQGGREFGTRIGVQVVGDSVWQKQDLYSPRVPIVRTQRTADGLEIIEEAFAVTDLRQTDRPTTALRRVDGGGENRDWAKPPAGTEPSLQHIAVHMGGSIAYEVTVQPGGSCRVALALCEGWWSEAGQRIQVLRVEGAEPKTVDTVAGLGKNKPGAFWFDAAVLILGPAGSLRGSGGGVDGTVG